MIVAPADSEVDDRDKPNEEPRWPNPNRDRPDWAEETPPKNVRPPFGTTTPEEPDVTPTIGCFRFG